MQRVRARQNDGIDAGINNHRIELADQLEPISGRRVAKLVGVAADGAGEAQPIALALDRFDEGPAPPAETDDSCVDHRPAARFLGARSTEVLVKEPKDFMP